MSIQSKAQRIAKGIARRIRGLARRIEGDTRAEQLRDEVSFWKSYFVTRGLKWPQDYLNRLDPNLPLQHHVSQFADRLQNDVINILDVGAGPITTLGRIHPTKRVVIIATDLLASDYNKLLLEFGINPDVRTRYANADKLSEQFKDIKFDIVYAQNSIDHTKDPMHVIEQMISVTKSGGFVVLLHAQKEGLNEGYQQLHKWDFECEEGDFIISGPGPNGDRINASQIFSKLGRVECESYPGYGSGGKHLPFTEFGVLVSIQKF